MNYRRAICAHLPVALETQDNGGEGEAMSGGLMCCALLTENLGLLESDQKALIKVAQRGREIGI